MTLESPGTIAPEQSKAERKVERILAALRSGRQDHARSLLAALPLERPRIMRAIARQLEQLAVANDGCLIEFASALHLRAHDTDAAHGIAKAISSAADLLVKVRRWPETVELLRLALALHPQPRVKRHLAGALANMGERPEAVSLLLSLLLSNPANVSSATQLARLVDADQMVEIGEKIGPLAVAYAEANRPSTARCAQVLVRLMRSEEAGALLSRLGSLEDPETASTAFDIGINTGDAALASRALQSRSWNADERLEKDTWLTQLALQQADRPALAAAYERLSAAESLDLLGKTRRTAGNALGRYADAISGIWHWARRRHIAEVVPQLIQPDETMESLAGKRVLIIAFTELGDEIYPLELIDRIRKSFASCTIVVDRRIAGLVARNRDGLIVVGKEKSAPTPDDNAVPPILRRHLGADVWAEIDRFDKVLLIQDVLALLLRTGSDLPHHSKTLDASPELRAKWRQELARYGDRPRLGLFWRSGRITYKRTAKSTHLHDWIPLLEDFRGSVVSLQFGHGVSEEIAAFQGTFPIVEIPGLDTRDDLESVAALMCELDMVVTIPGTTMHLAGALGVRTLAVSHPSQFLQRVRQDGRTSMWSPSVEVVSGPWELGFDGAIQSASGRLRSP